MSAPLPEDEADRLTTLRQYQILDTPPEAEFDNLTTLSSRTCSAPIALITLIDEKRQWFKSKVGLELAETPRSDSFCAYTILQRDILLVQDAREDKRFANNPYVLSGPKIRFYAGVPLVTPAGHAVGSLCVLDMVPRTLSKDQLDTLMLLRQHVVMQFEFRKKLAELAHVAREREWMIVELKKELAGLKK